MNVITAIQDYVTKMLSNIPGMKVLLMDSETIGIVSLVFSQSQILQKEVYLFEKIDNEQREEMSHLKAICFLRPTQNNISYLCHELKNPKYGEYHLFFSNVIENFKIDAIAEADEHEVVQQLQEYFGDFFAVNPDLFTLNLRGVVSKFSPKWGDQLNRSVEGICSCLLSLKKQPAIRYAAKSELVQRVVEQLSSRIFGDRDLFTFQRPGPPPLLLILDRKDDPITPLLTQWTYQAMVHELFEISNNRVDLSHVQGIKKDMKEIVLSCEQDPFFRQNMYANFGELGDNVKSLVDEYSRRTKTNQNIQSLDDIKRFVEEFPEFKKQAGNVSKHVTLMSEISKVVDERSLLEISELEQEMVNGNDHSGHLRILKEYVQNPKYQPFDILKLVLIYALRYETNTSNEVQRLADMLYALGLHTEDVGLISALYQYASSNARGLNLFGGKMSQLGKNLIRGMKGVQNVYTEHKPLLKQILDNLFSNKLKETEFPFAKNFDANYKQQPPQTIIVFIVGGITYEEALIVNEFNSRTGNKVILGGTHVHNAKSFLKDVAQLRNLS